MDLNRSELGAVVRDRMTRLGITKRELALMMGRAESFVNRIVMGEQVGSVETLIELAQTLQVEPGIYLNVLAGYNPPDDKDKLDISDLKLTQRIELEKYLAYLRFQSEHEPTVLNESKFSKSVERTRQKQQAQLEDRRRLKAMNGVAAQG